MQYYEQCLPIRQEVGDKIGEGTTLNNIATIYRSQGKYKKALEYYKQALVIAQELGNRDGEARTLCNIGLTYKNMGEFAKAEEHVSLAVEIAKAIGHPLFEKWRDELEQVRAEQQGA